MNLNPLDRAPTLPPGIEPVTEREMCELVALHYVESLDMDADTALHRAEQATRNLLEKGLVAMWGVRDGQVTFVPSAKAQTEPLVVYVLRRQG